MTKRSRHTQLGLVAVLALFVVGVIAVPGAHAQANMRQINLDLSTGQLVTLPLPAKNVFIADPAIADLQVPSARNVFVFGKKTGTTSLYALDAAGRQIFAATITVSFDTTQLQKLVQQEAPQSPVSFTSTPSGLEISGTVPNAETAEKLRSAAQGYIGDKETLINQLKVSGSQQVNLRVRVAEVDRQVTQQLGFNWQSIISSGAFSFGLATGRSGFLVPGTSTIPITRANSPDNVTDIPGSLFGNFQSGNASVDSLIDALANQGLVTILAEPNLTTISGQPASFLAGGEFPIPVPGANGSVTITFKQYGVSLDFVPTVLANNHISIKVRPEVSQLSSQGAVTIGSVTVPALTVRRAETSVELGSGESFAIAGLIQNNSNTNLSKFPGLGDLPVLGPLFHSTSFQRNQSELVIIVTPYTVRPADATALRAPTDGFQAASDVERIFLDRFNSGKSENAAGTAGQIGITGERLHGDAGFIVN